MTQLLYKQLYFDSIVNKSIDDVYFLVASFIAGSIQLYAQHVTDDVGTNIQNIGKVNMTYVPSVHILWTVPQYIFLGISEVLVGLTGETLSFIFCCDFQRNGTRLWFTNNVLSMKPHGLLFTLSHYRPL